MGITNSNWATHREAAEAAGFAARTRLPSGGEQGHNGRVPYSRLCPQQLGGCMGNVCRRLVNRPVPFQYALQVPCCSWNAPTPAVGKRVVGHGCACASVC